MSIVMKCGFFFFFAALHTALNGFRFFLLLQTISIFNSNGDTISEIQKQVFCCLSDCAINIVRLLLNFERKKKEKISISLRMYSNSWISNLFGNTTDFDFIFKNYVIEHNGRYLLCKTIKSIDHTIPLTKNTISDFLINWD